MEIFKNKNFVLLFFASFASQMGSTIGNMAFAFYLLDHFSKQPYYATIAELMYSLPTLFVFFIVGVLADRMDRKKIAENSDWIRAALTAFLLAAIYLQSLPAVFFILFVRSAVSKFFAPAETGLLQGVLNKDQYMQAAGINQSVFGLFMLFGVGLGAATYHYLGIEIAVIIDGISFIISGLLIRSCKISEEVRLPNGKTKFKDLGLKIVVKDFKDGITYIVGNRLLLIIIIGFFIFGLTNGVFAVLPIFTMKYKLAPDSYEKFSSLFYLFLGIGFLVGSVIGTALSKKLKPPHIIIWGVMIVSILTVIMGLVTDVWIFLAIVFLMGTVLAPANIALGGWMPEIVDPSMMGRVEGWIDPLMMLAQSLALGLIAIMYPSLVSISGIYYGLAACLFIVFIYYLITLPKLSRQSNPAIQEQQMQV